MEKEFKIKYNISTDCGFEVPEEDQERLNDVIMIDISNKIIQGYREGELCESLMDQFDEVGTFYRGWWSIEEVHKVHEYRVFWINGVNDIEDIIVKESSESAAIQYFKDHYPNKRYHHLEKI